MLRHPHQASALRRGARLLSGEVQFDRQWHVPVHITAYDWPENLAGQAPLLAEYSYSTCSSMSGWTITGSTTPSFTSSRESRPFSVLDDRLGWPQLGTKPGRIQVVMDRRRLEQDAPSRFIVGIDLAPRTPLWRLLIQRPSAGPCRRLRCCNWFAPHQVEARETLPSFHYHSAPGEFTAGAVRLPWQANEADYAVGAFAQSHGETSPGRLITSAKSWLCHAGVDRTAELLPGMAPPMCRRISPVEASSRYLGHIRAAWNTAGRASAGRAGSRAHVACFLR